MEIAIHELDPVCTYLELTLPFEGVPYNRYLIDEAISKTPYTHVSVKGLGSKRVARYGSLAEELTRRKHMFFDAENLVDPHSKRGVRDESIKAITNLCMWHDYPASGSNRMPLWAALLLSDIAGLDASLIDAHCRAWCGHMATEFSVTSPHKSIQIGSAFYYLVGLLTAGYIISEPKFDYGIRIKKQYHAKDPLHEKSSKWALSILPLNIKALFGESTLKITIQKSSGNNTSISLPRPVFRNLFYILNKKFSVSDPRALFEKGTKLGKVIRDEDSVKHFLYGVFDQCCTISKTQSVILLDKQPILDYVSYCLAKLGLNHYPDEGAITIDPGSMQDFIKLSKHDNPHPALYSV